MSERSVRRPAIRPASTADHERLVEVWRAAVEHTHHFLTPEDIDWYETQVRHYLPESCDLRVAVDAADRPVGFIAQSDGEIQMLFVDPARHGSGIGTALIDAIGAEFSTLRLDVNEDNPSGRRFYAARGFEQIGRSEHDREGRSFPLLHLIRQRTDRAAGTQPAALSPQTANQP